METVEKADISFTELTFNDLHYVKDIYDYYILNTTATYFTEKISANELLGFIPVNHDKYKSYLIKIDNKVGGFCYFGPYKKRQAYRRTAEISLYLRPEYTGQGIGKIVINFLEKQAESNGISVIVGIISGDNESSIRLFEKCGYEKCAHFRQIGEKFGRVLDVVCYEKIFR